MSQKNFVSFGDAETLMTELVTVIDNKVDKINGKGLSTNDYSDADKSIVDGVTSALAGKVDTSLVGFANGVAELDANGRVPSAQLPSYVDDVLEYADLAHFPATGETGKIYIAEDTNKTYRWSGTGYAEISESLALGETSSTAYAGNKGKANADAINGMLNGTSLDSFGDVEDAIDEITKYGIGAPIDILNYDDTSRFTCPSDGYVVCNLHAGDTVWIKNSYDRVIMGCGTGLTVQLINSLFVRKGMVIYCSDVSRNPYVTFYPII